MLEVKYSVYKKNKERLSRFINNTPEFIPSNEEVDYLESLTQEIRTDKPVKTYEYKEKPDIAEGIKFLKKGEVGKPYITENDFCMYLLYLQVTATPRNKDDEERMSYISSCLKRHLKITTD